MRPVPFVFLVLILLSPSLLTSCQGPKVTVVVNRLNPGMLKGKTIGVEGMLITASNWPGEDIDAPVLSKAEEALQHSLKGARVCLLSDAGMSHESLPTGKASATSSPVIRPEQADYIFRIMLRSDSNKQRINHWQPIGYSSRLRSVRDPRWNAFGGWAGFNEAGFDRKVTTRTLKADYILSDAHTYKLVWRAEAVTSDKYVSFDTSIPRDVTSDVETKVPLRPLWISMNATAVHAIKHPGSKAR